MGTPAISSVVKGEKDKSLGVSVFSAMILALVRFYGGNWDASQVKECALVCYDEWYYLTFAELSHFSKRAKTGFFGKMYGSFAPSILIDWLSTYAAETDSKRGNYFGGIKTSFDEPQNPVDTEKIKSLVSELEGELLIQKADKEIEYQKNRMERLKKMEDLARHEQENPRP